MKENTLGTLPSEKKILIVGLGMIGGSLALALKKRGFQGLITGYDRNAEEIALGKHMGVIDSGSTDLIAEASDASLIVLCVPVMAIGAIVAQLAACRRDDAVVTDVGSTKTAIRDQIAAHLGALPAWMILGHPIAGSEHSGVAAAKPNRFCHHKVILTPEAHTNLSMLARVEALWRSVGAQVVCMGVEHHDDVLARTSHLPHLLAFSLVDTLARQDASLEIFRYAAGGFRDFTRIAGSDPEMWRDVYLANPDAVLFSLDDFETGLKRLRAAIEQHDGDAMLDIFTQASQARRHFQQLLNKTTHLPSDQSMEQNVRYFARKGGNVNGRIRVPGDKSMSHRSIMLGALAEGITQVEGFLEGEDSLATLKAFRAMGVDIDGPEQGRVTIHGVGLNGLKAPENDLNLGNAGTGMRLFAGLMAGQAFDTTLTGDASLSKRPMNRVADPLRLMGAKIDTAEQGRPPMHIHGGQSLKGIDYDMPMASAQVKSCLLLAGMYADGETRVTEPAPTRDHTERMLNGFGYPVERQGATAIIRGGGRLKGGNIDVPADISSAAFFLVAASITPGADLVLEHVGINPTRVGVINILQSMGADITLSNEHEVGGEPVADIHVRYTQLKGIDIDDTQVPLAIDEFPVLFIAAANAQGTTRLRNAAELRVKESDRIQAMADGLAAIGVTHKVQDDGIDIEGGAYHGGTIDSHGDHRIAMAFTVAALCAEGDIEINDCANVATSFPNFQALADEVGMRLDVTVEQA